jgi:hypothetical protein
MSRLADLERFYALINRLSARLGATRPLADLRSSRDWPHRGVYFFFELGEVRHESGEGHRIVRVGTHALGIGSRSTLRQRLGQHRGGGSGGGNHRGSIFRLLVGQALLARGDLPPCKSWGVKGDIAKAAGAPEMERTALAAAEAPIERAVSSYLSAMPCLWIGVDDEPGPGSLRGVIERNAIALLSNFRREPLDPASPSWLGRFSDRELVSGSGLWNQRHVEEAHDSAFLNVFESLTNQGDVGSYRVL